MVSQCVCVWREVSLRRLSCESQSGSCTAMGQHCPCKSCRALEKHFDHLHFMCKEVNYNDGEDSHWHDNLIRREL